MTRDEVLQVLKDHEAELRRRGVAHAALFGSLARGEAGPKSDIDIIVELNPKAHVGLWGYAEVVEYVRALFDRPVDVAQKQGLKRHVRPSAERDALYAF
ncbi:MAG TPA: nucleotidyltransferase family protein [Caulobacteraceae bacterium]